jgi:16S rRNA (guanine527-N7)-methyltransferase
MFHVKHEPWPGALARLGLDLNQEVLETLERYEELLRARSRDYGLVSSGDLPRLRERHLMDSLRAVPHLPTGLGSVCDLGSGGGLPGLVIAIAAPERPVTLVEIRRRKVAFLELAVERLGLRNVRIHAGDPASCAGPFAACTARAFRNAEGAWAAATLLLAPEGVLLYWAGAGFDPSEVPPGVRAVLRTSTLAWSGPLVIMSRQ